MYWQIETNDSRRPDYPQDNTIIIRANSMEDALKKFTNNRGKSTLKGQPILCKEIFYVKDDWE